MCRFSMANEWVCMTNPRRFKSITVADANALVKGTLMMLSADPNTAVAHAAGSWPIPVGVLMEDKVALDGKTRMSVALDGEWEVTVDAGACTLGYPIMASTLTANDVAMVGDTAVSFQYLRSILGRCDETASASETGVRISLNLPG